MDAPTANPEAVVFTYHFFLGTSVNREGKKELTIGLVSPVLTLPALAAVAPVAGLTPISLPSVFVPLPGSCIFSTCTRFAALYPPPGSDSTVKRIDSARLYPAGACTSRM